MPPAALEAALNAAAPGAGLALRSGGTLVERAIGCLSRGPMTTPEVAGEVLALRGNPSAAAAAVFALLGTDPRVSVDGRGIWSLRPVAPITRQLLDEEWVVVDVETTGGGPSQGHRIIEFAAVRVAGGRIVGEYSTLVNPRRPIPRMVTSLTGIADGAVAGAPYFEEVAEEVWSALSGRVFVAHNATFDWRFVSSELERSHGRTLHGRRLCTLRLARRLLPHLRSRSLGSLADYFGIEMVVHHRALYDAAATARLLLRFFDALAEQEVTDWRALETFFSRPAAPRLPRRAHPRSLESA